MTSYISSTNNNKFSNVRPENTIVNTIVLTQSVCKGDIYQTLNTLSLLQKDFLFA
jgi:hypothetical protein